MTPINHSPAHGALVPVMPPKKVKGEHGTVEKQFRVPSEHHILQIPPNTVVRLAEGTILKTVNRITSSHSLDTESNMFIVIDDLRFGPDYPADKRFIKDYYQQKKEEIAKKRQEAERKAQEIKEASRKALYPCTQNGLLRSIRCLGNTVPCLLIAAWIYFEVNHNY